MRERMPVRDILFRGDRLYRDKPSTGSAVEERFPLSEYGRRRLLTYADSFRELSRSMEESGVWENILQNEAGTLQGGEGCFPGGEPDRADILEANRLEESRKVLCDNMNEMAQIMDQLASEVFRLRPLEERKRRTIVQSLKAEGIVVTDLYYIDRPGERTGLGITMYSKRMRHTGEQVADMLSVLLNNRLEVSVASPYQVNEMPGHFVFVEEAAYVVLSGTAKAVKEGEEVSGDNYAVVESERGRLTALLSDGMGSGAKACADSEVILELMEKMLEAGYSLPRAIHMVNTTLSARAERRNMSTLDACELDLYEGTVSFYKMGGAATFLKQGNRVEQVDGHSLPLGIFQTTEPAAAARKVQDGDYLIMMTDGVLEALGQNRYEETMRQIIGTLKEQNPKEIARSILQFVLHCSGGRVQDDMTVLVLGIWENS